MHMAFSPEVEVWERKKNKNKTLDDRNNATREEANFIVKSCFFTFFPKQCNENLLLSITYQLSFFYSLLNSRWSLLMTHNEVCRLVYLQEWTWLTLNKSEFHEFCLRNRESRKCELWTHAVAEIERELNGSSVQRVEFFLLKQVTDASFTFHLNQRQSKRFCL